MESNENFSVDEDSAKSLEEKLEVKNEEKPKKKTVDVLKGIVLAGIGLVVLILGFFLYKKRSEGPKIVFILPIVIGIVLLITGSAIISFNVTMEKLRKAAEEKAVAELKKAAADKTLEVK
jgi:hypothetical protein